MENLNVNLERVNQVVDVLVSDYRKTNNTSRILKYQDYMKTKSLWSLPDCMRSVVFDLLDEHMDYDNIPLSERIEKKINMMVHNRFCEICQ